MTWHFDDLVKGQVTQALLQTLLERVGYRVHRLGVEELLPELRTSGHLPYRGNLPLGIRFLPDFLVLDPDSGDVHLTEVKFRSRLSEPAIQGLLKEVLERLEYWPRTVTVVMIAETDDTRGYHQDHIRVITPETVEEFARDTNTLRERWKRLPQLQEQFGRLFGSFDNQQVADSVTTPLRDLAKIRRPRVADLPTEPPELTADEKCARDEQYRRDREAYKESERVWVSWCSEFLLDVVGHIGADVPIHPDREPGTTLLASGFLHPEMRLEIEMKASFVRVAFAFGDVNNVERSKALFGTVSTRGVPLERELGRDLYWNPKRRRLQIDFDDLTAHSREEWPGGTVAQVAGAAVAWGRIVANRAEQAARLLDYPGDEDAAAGTRRD